MNNHEKLFISLRYWLHGRDYMQAAEALHFSASYHQGKRKDGHTPEFFHQLTIAHFLRTLSPSLIFPEATISAGLLHDVREDYEVGLDVIEAHFGAQVARSVHLLTKKVGRVSRSPDEYFHSMTEDPIASIVKGVDRAHNFQSMPGVFSPEKQEAYIVEAETYILPMLKQARRMHPRQELAYENVKSMLTSQIELLRHALKAHTKK